MLAYEVCFIGVFTHVHYCALFSFISVLLSCRAPRAAPSCPAVLPGLPLPDPAVLPGLPPSSNCFYVTCAISFSFLPLG